MASRAHGSGGDSQTVEVVLFVLLLGAGAFAVFGPKSAPRESAATATTAATSSARQRPTALTAAPAGSAQGARGLGEVQFLQGARRSLAQGKPDDALRDLKNYEQRFPNGRLLDDVVLLRVEAQVRRGDHDAATKLAEGLIAKAPDSRQAKRAKALLAGTPSAPSPR